MRHLIHLVNVHIHLSAHRPLLRIFKAQIADHLVASFLPLFLSSVAADCPAHQEYLSAYTMDDKVRSFNRLIRQQTTPSGLPNHWVFGVRQVPLQPPGDVVVAVHPLSSYILLSGLGPILSSLNASDKAQALLSLLLDAFLRGPNGQQSSDFPPFAPWTWAAEDPELVGPLERCLSQHGFVNELCRIGACSDDDKNILQAVWSRGYQAMTSLIGRGIQSPPSQPTVIPVDTTRCHGCGVKGESFSEPLKKCSACGMAWYHSKDCQRKHWKMHKPACLANRPTNTNTKSDSSASSTSAVDSMGAALSYYNTTARSSPEAQALMKTLYLDFPSSPTATEGVG